MGGNILQLHEFIDALEEFVDDPVQRRFYIGGMVGNGSTPNSGPICQTPSRQPRLWRPSKLFAVESGSERGNRCNLCLLCNLFATYNSQFQPRSRMGTENLKYV